MSDLSWLNPTPHAIAVYASRPLSPVATQHSLSSGRYPLLGPDFHRLDRTSLRLAHSFDHLVDGHEQFVRHGEAEHPGGRGVDDELELARLHVGQPLHRAPWRSCETPMKQAYPPPHSLAPQGAPPTLIA